VERCSRRALAMGYGGFSICNIFALRSTDPMALYEHPHPVSWHGEPGMNDSAILYEARAGGMVICGWGSHGRHLERGAKVLAMLQLRRIKTYALRMTKGGEPGHPLYIPYSQQPFEVQ
jgi:hypothetical protein